jgi:predicted nucleic-acid-binding protein
MIGVDTNILVRLAVKDDERQYDIAARFFQTQISAENPAYITLIAVAEFAWTLRRAYKFSDEHVIQILERLQNADNVEFERQETVANAASRCRSERIDFSDCLIAAIHQEDGCSHIVTFDRDFAASGQAILLS